MAKTPRSAAAKPARAAKAKVQVPPSLPDRNPLRLTTPAAPAAAQDAAQDTPAAPEPSPSIAVGCHDGDGDGADAPTGIPRPPPADALPLPDRNPSSSVAMTPPAAAPVAAVTPQTDVAKATSVVPLPDRNPKAAGSAARRRRACARAFRLAAAASRHRHAAARSQSQSHGGAPLRHEGHAHAGNRRAASGDGLRRDPEADPVLRPLGIPTRPISGRCCAPAPSRRRGSRIRRPAISRSGTNIATARRSRATPRPSSNSASPIRTGRRKTNCARRRRRFSS